MKNQYITNLFNEITKLEEGVEILEEIFLRIHTTEVKIPLEILEKILKYFNYNDSE